MSGSSATYINVVTLVLMTQLGLIPKKMQHGKPLRVTVSGTRYFLYTSRHSHGLSWLAHELQLGQGFPLMNGGQRNQATCLKEGRCMPATARPVIRVFSRQWKLYYLGLHSSIKSFRANRTLWMMVVPAEEKKTKWFFFFLPSKRDRPYPILVHLIPQCFSKRFKGWILSP